MITYRSIMTDRYVFCIFVIIFIKVALNVFFIANFVSQHEHNTAIFNKKIMDIITIGYSTTKTLFNITMAMLLIYLFNPLFYEFQTKRLTYETQMLLNVYGWVLFFEIINNYIGVDNSRQPTVDDTADGGSGK